MSNLTDKIFGDRGKKIHRNHCIYCGKESDALYCSEECMSQDRAQS